MLTTQGPVAQLFLSYCVNQKEMWDCGGRRRDLKRLSFGFWVTVPVESSPQEVEKEGKIASLPGVGLLLHFILFYLFLF